MKIARILANNSTSLDNLSVGDAGNLSHCYGEPGNEGCRNNPPVLLSNPRAFFNVQIITMQSLGRALFNKISWSKLPFILSFVHEIILPEPPPVMRPSPGCMLYCCIHAQGAHCIPALQWKEIWIKCTRLYWYSSYCTNIQPSTFIDGCSKNLTSK